MTEYVHVEPSHDQRPFFALWCLAQEPPIQTASASGFDVPTDRYPFVPPEYLEGAYVDGFRLDRQAAQPAPRTEGFQGPRDAASETARPSAPTDAAKAAGKPRKAAQPRKRAARVQVTAPDTRPDGGMEALLFGGSE
jgi:hypothetical protein